jgi:hypothetical protein
MREISSVGKLHDLMSASFASGYFNLGLITEGANDRL